MWVLDTEGNGQNPGEIIELAAVEMIDLTVTGRIHQWRFRPRQQIHYSATRVHGITNDDLASCPPIEEHLDEIFEVLGERAVAGHAVHVEVNALQRVRPGWEPPNAYDTLRMARRAYPELARHRLSSVGDHLGLSATAARITRRRAHSALYDALLCGLIMRHVVIEAGDEGGMAMLDHGEIMAFRRERREREARKAAKVEMRRRLGLR